MRLIDADAFAAQYGDYYAEEGPEEGFIGTVGELIAKQPAVNRWISCGRRLPEDGVKCLVCMSDKNILIGKWDGKYDKQGVWCITIPSFGTKLFRIKNVPFWMPLPEPPESEVRNGCDEN